MTNRFSWAQGLIYLLAALVSLYSVFPFVYAIATSLKTGTALFGTDVLPDQPTLDNYISLFTTAEQPFGRHILNSILVSSRVVALSLWLGLTAAYAMGRVPFKGRGILLGSILAVSMFPQVAVLAGMFELMRVVGLYNQALGLILPYMIFTLPFTVWVLTTFDQGTRSSYSEPGSNLLVTAYGGEFCSTQTTTTTTDVSGPTGYNNGNKPEDYANNPDYTRCMNGTSAATPEAAGAVALLLEANPNLTWRDVRAILATTARKTDPLNADWQTNAAGFKVNHEYGYGVIDALAAVKAAPGWSLLPAQKTATKLAALNAPLAIPDNASPVTSTVSLSGSGISKLEFVELSLTSDHSHVGNLEVQLTSPSGTASTVSVVRECKDATTCGAAFSSGFTFGIARLMGEAADGTWTLSVRDGKAGDSGAISAWSIKAYGH